MIFVYGKISGMINRVYKMYIRLIIKIKKKSEAELPGKEAEHSGKEAELAGLHFSCLIIVKKSSWANSVLKPLLNQ